MVLPISFLDRIARVFGPRSEGDNGRTFTNQAALGESSGQNEKPMVFGMSDSDGLSGNEFSENRYLALYNDLRRRYEALHERLGLRLGWYELTDIFLPRTA